jgi:hypothetical protein
MENPDNERIVEKFEAYSNRKKITNCKIKIDLYQQKGKY